MEGRLPQVDKLLRHPLLEEEQLRWRRDVFVEVCRQTLAQLRSSKEAVDAGLDEVARLVLKQARELLRPGLRKVINGTGVVLNTNLGRAPLHRAAVNTLSEIACGYSNLELDLSTGKRGKRSERIKALLKLLTGCQSSLVVNNNAAAVVLAVNCFARNREVIVSRGELIEIGGSFRLPDVIEAAGARLREVGTTNRTRISDYEAAIGEGTGMFMRCHRSNFKITGFTEEVSLAQLVDLSRRRNIPFLEDLGSGVLVDLSSIGLQEPTVAEVTGSGCGLVSFSGDKLLGGPQAGIIAGRKELIDQLSRHPLYRALRVDKITNVLLEHTLMLYLRKDFFQEVPTLKMMALDTEMLKDRAQRLTVQCQKHCSTLRFGSSPCQSAIGGGSLPGEEKPSWCIVVDSRTHSAAELAKLLREVKVPVIGVVRNDELRIDLRTVPEVEEEILIASLQDVDRAVSDPGKQLSDNRQTEI